MNQKSGIILLEVLISIMISSMIFVTLMGAMFQLSKSRITIDNTIDIYTNVTTILNIMQHDFSGLTIPVQTEFPVDQSDNTHKKNVIMNDKNSNSSDIINSQTSEQGLEKKEQKKPIKNILYGTFKENNSHILSCITNNPMPIYWSERAGKAKPRLARIVYTLVADPEHKESFILKRQEGTELDFDAYKDTENNNVIRAYEIAHGIKSFKITYVYLEKKEEQQGSKENSEKKESPTKPDYKIKYEWSTHTEKENSQSRNTKVPFLPSHMIISLTMFNNTYKQEYDFEFVINLPANQEEQIKQAKIRYQKEIQKNGSSPKNNAVIIPEKTESKKSAQSDNTSLELIALHTKTDDVIVDTKIPESAEAHNLIAENDIQQSIEQFYQNIIREKEKQINIVNESEELYDNAMESIDTPESKIDIINDGDTTHIVYQGPIVITPDLLQGAS